MVPQILIAGYLAVDVVAIVGGFVSVLEFLGDYLISDKHERNVELANANMTKILGDICTSLAVIASDKTSKSSVFSSRVSTWYDSEVNETYEYKKVNTEDSNLRNLMLVLHNAFLKVGASLGSIDDDKTNNNVHVPDSTLIASGQYFKFDDSFNSLIDKFYFLNTETNEKISITKYLKSLSEKGFNVNLENLENLFKINIDGAEYSLAEIVYHSLNFTQDEIFDNVVKNMTFQIGDMVYSFPEILFKCLTINKDSNFPHNIADTTSSMAANADTVICAMRNN